jgi:hypothetical protein
MPWLRITFLSVFSSIMHVNIHDMRKMTPVTKEEGLSKAAALLKKDIIISFSNV